MVYGGLNELRHEEGAEESVQSVPDQESWKDISTKSSIGECRLGGMKAHCNAEYQKEIMRQLAELILDLVLEKHHGHANKEGRQDDDESCDT